MNNSNLIPADQRSTDEARENGRKGGIASGQARREKKLLKESILERMNEGDWNEMIDALIERAKESDKAFVVLRDTIGQKPIDRIEQNNVLTEKSLERLHEDFGL